MCRLDFNEERKQSIVDFDLHLATPNHPAMTFKKLLVCLPAALGFSFLIAEMQIRAFAQQLPPQASTKKKSDSVPVVPKTEEFKKATADLRDLIKRLVELELRFHNSETADQENRYRREWYDQREKAFDLHRAMLRAGLAEFQAAPDSNSDLAKFLFATLKRNVEGDVIEGMLPIAKALSDAKYPAPEITGLYAMCCLAENEFEAAREPIERLLQTKNAPAELVAVYEQLDEMESAWQRELSLRNRDAGGDPLPQAKVVTTKGTFVIELFENDAPQAVANFISLAEKGFYNYNQFFLVISNARAQAGCPKADGTGGPGYFIPRESEEHTRRSIFRGSVGLALLPDLPDSGGSQFMIAFMPSPELEKHSTVFGRVISGMPNVARLDRVDPNAKKKKDDPNQPPEPPAVPDEIISVEISGKRNHPYEPQKLASPYKD